MIPNLSHVPAILDVAEDVLRKEKSFAIDIGDNDMSIEPGAYTNLQIADFLRQIRISVVDFNEFLELK